MKQEWKPRGRDFDVLRFQAVLVTILDAVRRSDKWDGDALGRILAQHPRDSKGLFSKIELVTGYEQLVAAGALPFERRVMHRLQMKPIRTSSGVAPVTVLTEPAGCPGRCIFCPDAEGMPKSYLPNEPGARRAAECKFDPYLQVQTRLATFAAMGHTADKVELLILGGTWSAYSRRYREEFVKRCLEAMNGAESATLLDAQQRNETSYHRNVGLVIETRPDWVTPAEVYHLRQLGVTKVQLGVQSLDDRILELNGRGHTVETVRRAVGLLRSVGFKLHLHWMPNLHGATPESDRKDFARLWDDPGLRPDELKIYPCSIIKHTALYALWEHGEFRPYADEELVDLVADCKATIPRYCRVNRVFRDIPADDIVAGSKRSNLRQLVQERMKERGQVCQCMRCREVRDLVVEEIDLRLLDHAYETSGSLEHFLSYETAEGKLAGFLRLSLPALAHRDASGLSNRSGSGNVEPAHAVWSILPEIRNAAMIREVHVYGPALGIGAASAGEAQHLGLGQGLIAEATSLARSAGFARLAVISAIGTRRYYERLGFEPQGLYLVKEI